MLMWNAGNTEVHLHVQYLQVRGNNMLSDLLHHQLHLKVHVIYMSTVMSRTWSLVEDQNLYFQRH